MDYDRLDGESGSNVTTGTEITLTPTEKFTNTDFETDLTGWSNTNSYILNDEFTTDLAAGSVNGTSAEPTGGVRTVVDTNSKLSIVGGKLSFETGGVQVGNPGLWYPSLERGVGRVFMSSVVQNGGFTAVGFDNGMGGDINEGVLFYSNDIYARMASIPTSYVKVGAITYDISYQVAVVVRNAGVYFYIKGGSEYPTWTLLYFSSSQTSTPLYPGVSVYTSNCTGYIHIGLFGIE